MDTVIIGAILIVVTVVIVRHCWRAIRGKSPSCSCQNQDKPNITCCQNRNCSKSNITDQENNRT